MKDFTRICTACGIEKPLSEYSYSNKVKRDKRRSKCKKCTSSESKAYYSKRKNMDKPRAEFKPRPCTKCGVVKDKDDFGAEKRARDGYYRQCRECRYKAINEARKRRVEKHGWDAVRDLDDANAYSREWRRNNPGRVRASMIRHKYGLSLQEVENLIASQDGKCAICREAQEDLQIDHCHDSGKVRGMLCGPCNRALGLFKDNPNSIKRAVEYLTI